MNFSSSKLLFRSLLAALGLASLSPAAETQVVVAANDATTGNTASAAAPVGAAASESEEAFVDEYATAGPQVRDPFEKINRTLFKFNDSVYRHVLRPVARGYETVVPAVARRGLTSFFDNIRFPVRFVGCALQGKIDRAGAETGKFVINSTVGLAGFIKVSDRVPELRVPEEDVGQVFGRWGVGHGPFLVLPVLGPSSLRDLTGRVGNTLLTPTTWSFLDHYDWEVRAGLQAADVISGLPSVIRNYESFRQAAVDPYVAFRNGYIQYRDGEVAK